MRGHLRGDQIIVSRRSSVREAERVEAQGRLTEPYLSLEHEDSRGYPSHLRVARR